MEPDGRCAGSRPYRMAAFPSALRIGMHREPDAGRVQRPAPRPRLLRARPNHHVGGQHDRRPTRTGHARPSSRRDPACGLRAATFRREVTCVNVPTAGNWSDVPAGLPKSSARTAALRPHSTSQSVHPNDEIRAFSSRFGSKTFRAYGITDCSS